MKLSGAFVVFLMICGMSGASAHAALRPADLVVNFGPSAGNAKPLGKGRYILNLNPSRQVVRIRSVSDRGLVGSKPVLLRQKLDRYVGSWRRSFSGEGRAGALVIPGARGGVVPLRLSKPTLNRRNGVISVVASVRRRLDSSFPDLNTPRRSRPPSTFRGAKLEINDNGWYKMIAHMDAYNELGGCGESGYEGPDFKCHGKGQDYATEPFKGQVGFGSTKGGAAFWATGKAYFWNPSGTEQLTSSARLVGTQAWGWRSNKLTITPDSYFKQDWSTCMRHPFSGTDESLNGQPGGTIDVKLYENGSVWINKGFTLELSGYLSEPFYTSTKCDS